MSNAYLNVVEGKIESGWDEKADAREHAKELLYDFGLKTTVLQRETCKKRGINPRIGSSDWYTQKTLDDLLKKNDQNRSKKMSIRNNPKYTIKKKPARSLTLKERAIEALTQTDGVDEPVYEFILYAVRRVDGEEAAREIQDMVEGNESEPVPRRSAPPRSSRPVEIDNEPEPDESFGGILNNPRKRGRPPGRKTINKTRKPIRL